MKGQFVAALLVLSAVASPAFAQAPKVAPALAPAFGPALGPALAPGPLGAFGALTYAAAPNGCQTVLSLLEGNPNFSSLLKLVQAAGPGLPQMLDDPRLEITVFAPTNAGIANALQQYSINQDMLLGSPSMLAEILYLHIIPNVLHADVLQNGYSFNTLLTDNNGPQALTVSVANGATKLSSGVDSATINSGEMPQCQAVVYSIDNLLIPNQTMG